MDVGTPTILPVGRERRPVAVIDGFSPAPEALRAAAAASPFAAARHLYPGIRADLPDRYWPDQRGRIAAAVAALGGDGAQLEVIDMSFSMVTAARDALLLAQRLPHVDAHGADRFAMVHYLFADAQGGTSFFRHRSTGFEYVDARRADIFGGQLDAELRHGMAPRQDYPVAGDTLFEPIASLPPVFNRAIVYRSNMLHSGAIPPDAELSPDPGRGRLTVTGFFRCGQA